MPNSMDVSLSILAKQEDLGLISILKLEMLMH
uniref:Uncharacterized protein n=1 Tax=Rhizophora mucronata TaxID=61149 RepID=A0A2P2J059_RHIMU